MGMHGSMAVAQGAAPVQPPSATTESVAAGGSPAGKTFGAFTDPDGAIASYTAGISNAVGSTSINSGSGLGAYAVTGSANGNSYTLYLNAKNSDGDIVSTAQHTVNIAAAVSGGWTTQSEVDFTADVTNVVLSKSDGQTVYEADGTTAKATVNANDRVGTTTSTYQVISGTGLQAVCASGSATSTSRYVSVNLDTSSIDWNAAGAVAVDFITSGFSMGNTNDAMLLGLSTDTSPVSGTNYGARYDFDGTNHVQAAYRRQASAGTTGADQNSDTSAPTAIAWRVILWGGRTAIAYWREQSSYLEGIPSGSGVLVGEAGRDALAQSTAEGADFGSTVRAALELVTRDTSNTTVVFEKCRLQTFA